MWLASLCGVFRQNALTVILSLTGFRVCWRELSSQGRRLFFLGGPPKWTGDIIRHLNEEYPGIKAFAHHGYFAASSSGEIASLVNAADPDLLIIGMGMPRQELWLVENLARLSWCSESLGCDTGVLCRPPKNSAPSQWPLGVGMAGQINKRAATSRSTLFAHTLEPRSSCAPRYCALSLWKRQASAARVEEKRVCGSRRNPETRSSPCTDRGWEDQSRYRSLTECIMHDASRRSLARARCGRPARRAAARQNRRCC